VLERIGQVVLSARNEAGRTLEELAREAGVQAKALESLEEGKPGVTTTQLTAIARALLLDPVALLNGRREDRPVPSVFLRHQPAQDFHDQDHAVLDEALEESRALNRLRELLGRNALGIPSNVFQAREAPTDSTDAPARDGYKVARDARRWLNQTKEPFADIRELIESRFGATVVLRKLVSTKVTAAAVRAGTAATIVLAASDWQRANNPLLTRVFLAHELCHALVDPLVGGLQIVLDESNDRKTNSAEQRARAFAAEFLLPLDGLSSLLGPPLSTSDGDAASRMIANARSHFGTPHEIAANHLCNLGFVNISLRERLEHDKTPFTGTAPATTLPQVGEPSIAVREHVESAHRDGHITDGEARAILGLDRLARLPWDPPTL
jgi:transcriptional regulator with XRE-family HTH domain